MSLFLGGKMSHEIGELRRILQNVEERRMSYIRCTEKAEEAIERLKERIKESESYRKCAQLIEEIQKSLKEISDYEGEVVKLFTYFKPFSYKRKVIDAFDGRLAVGTTIYEIYRGSRKYSSPEECLQLFMRNADDIIPNVRKSIREDLIAFHELVEALNAEKIRDGEILACRKGEFKAIYYDLPRVFKFGNGRIEIEGVPNLEEGHFQRVCICVERDNYHKILKPKLYLYKTRDMYYERDLSEVLVEKIVYNELYGVFVDICEEVCQKLRPVRRKYEEIMRRLREIMAPYLLSNL